MCNADHVDLLVRKLRVRDDVSAAEENLLRGIVGEAVEYGRRARIVRAGEHQTSSRLLLDGWVGRERVVADGRRQISQVHVPGDFVDLHSFLLKRLDHDIVALTPCRIAEVSHDRLKGLTEEHPHLARLLWLTTLMDAATHREWLAAMGRMSAFEHLAHFLCEIYRRLSVIGLAHDSEFELPLTQEELGDVCGLTSVHVNRVLQELRAKDLVQWTDKRVVIPDWERLRAAGQFNPIYLNEWKEPR
jgi:CRP-like cAMP-binding protein